MVFKVIKDLAQAQELWNTLSNKKTLYDTWELRFCFYKYFNYELFFYAGYEDDKLIGLLPLQYNSDKNYLEFFGDQEEWMDQNKIFILPSYEKYIPEFYNQINLPTKLNNIVGTDPFTQAFQPDENSYFLPLTNLHSYIDYFSTYLSSKKRSNFKNIIKKAEVAGIKTTLGTLSDLEKLFDLNIKSFGKDSSFLFPFRKEIFRDLAQLSTAKSNILVFSINNEIQGVTFGLIYNDAYIALNAGINKTLPFSLNSYATFQKIDTAIKEGVKIYDVRGGDYGWKEEWHFEKFLQYKFLKNI